jgi:hypothetical protein
MKESVITIKTIGVNQSIDLELLLDVGREFTEIDKANINYHIRRLIESIQAETISINPQSKIDAINEKTGIINCFGDRVIFVEQIPNGYDDSYYSKHLPWFVVTTTKGRIKIGWRKRVICIDWCDSIIKESAEALFPNEDVTKYEKLIHAWGYEKATEYINVLLK